MTTFQSHVDSYLLSSIYSWPDGVASGSAALKYGLVVAITECVLSLSGTELPDLTYWMVSI
jgi:hypothetical protein